MKERLLDVVWREGGQQHLKQSEEDEERILSICEKQDDNITHIYSMYLILG